LCGSRKYPYPPPQKVTGNSEGEGVHRQKFLRGGGSQEAPFPEGEETRKS